MAADLDLRAIVANAAPEDLPALVGKLAEAQAVAMARLSMAARGDGPAATAEPEYITPEQAATIAVLPMETPEKRKRSIRRIYGWAQGRPWASRPEGTKCLLIDEHRFRRFLARRIK